MLNLLKLRKVPFWLGKCIQSILLVGLLLLSPIFADGQAKALTGKIVDETGAGLPGVNIMVKGSTTGTITDADGNYQLDAEEGAVLEFSFIGYESQEMTLGSQAVIDIGMNVDVTALEEVVVIGYGSQRKSDLTGSVSTINMDAIEALPVTSIDKKLAGQVAGMQVKQVTGKPGGGTYTIIRGQGSLGAGNEPLYVVDGIPYATGVWQNFNALAHINPDNIESISVLKDASSTAIYGSRGSNGVILITTKKGEFNKTSVSASSEFGVSAIPSNGRIEVMNASEFAQFVQDVIGDRIRANENREPTPSDYPELYRNPAQLGEGTDWFDLLIRTARVQNHNVSITKGTKDSRLSFNLGYRNEEGILKETGIERFNGMLNMEANVSHSFKIGGSLQPSFLDQKSTDTDRHRDDVLNRALWLNPALPAFDENGAIIPFIDSPKHQWLSVQSDNNPLYFLQEALMTYKEFQNIGSVFAEWEITPGLTARTSLNTIYGNFTFEQYRPSTIGGTNSPPRAGRGSSYNVRRQDFNWLNENTVSYKKTFNDHSIDAVAGFSTQKFTSSEINIRGTPFPNDLIRTLNAAIDYGADEIINEWSLVSFLGRINYNFRDRYYLTATVRTDGSSRFGPNNRYATFPSAAVAWRVSEEDFLRDNNTIDNLKLRVSYGLSGNNNIGNYAHIAAVTAGQHVFDNSLAAASFVGLSNPFLTWEESTQFDVGIDLEMIGNRLNLTLDFYNKESRNMLLADVIPAISGFQTQFINQGSVRNRGIEVALGGRPITGAFRWDVNMNIAINRNKVLSTNASNDDILAGRNWSFPTHVTRPGYPLGQFFGFVWDGLATAEDMANPNVVKPNFAREGGNLYVDGNGDGVIVDIQDYFIIGNPHPDFIFGITNTFSYNNLRLSALITGQQGGATVNHIRTELDFTWGRNNLAKEWVNRWRSPTDTGDGIHGAPSIGGEDFTWHMNDSWVEDATFLRIANVTLDYTLPQRWIRSSGFINNALLYMSVQNLHTFTGYRGGNPESQSTSDYSELEQGWTPPGYSANPTLAPGWDRTAYPLARTISFGAKLGF